MPRLADHEERRREAIEALWRVIATQGIDKASVRHVAAETGWSRGIIDYYFDGMQELLVAGLRAACEADVSLSVRSGSAETDGELRDALLARMPLDATRRIRGRVWIAYLGRAMTDPEVAAEYAGCQQARGLMWAGYLSSGDHDLDEEQLQEAATLIMAFELAMNVNGLLNPEIVTEEWVERQVDSFIATFMARTA
jgi:AcrR family transcriptional regulator